jgi:hypothetical protein
MCAIAFAIIPSVVSIPPNSSTAAFATTSSAARVPAAAVSSSDLLPVTAAITASLSFPNDGV